MPRPFLTRAERQLIREKITESGVTGQRRAALLFRALYGPVSIPRERDFMEAFLWIEGKDTGAPIQWTFNRPQRIIEYLEHRRERAGIPVRDAILKARQWGVSKYKLGKAFSKATRNSDFKAAIVADINDTASALLEGAKVMYRKLPRDMRLPLQKSNRKELVYAPPHASRLEIYSEQSGDPLRGQTYRYAHCTEPAKWRDPMKAVAAISNAVPRRPGTSLSYESTARGMYNWWYEFWWAARKRENDFFGMFFPWWFDPKFDYCLPVYPGEAEEILSSMGDEEVWLYSEGVSIGQLKWRRLFIKEECFGDIDIFHQEMPATPSEAFLASGRPVFVPALVLNAEKRCASPVWAGQILVEGPDPMGERLRFKLASGDWGPLLIWEHPRKGCYYALTCDSGYGVAGGDYSYAVVGDMHTGRQVAAWHGICEPPEFGRICAALGWYYEGAQPAYCLPELSGPGTATLAAMRDAGYWNFGRRPIFDAVQQKNQWQLGWLTLAKSKEQLVNAIRGHLQAGNDGARFLDVEIAKELLQYQLDDRGGYSCPKGKHDDRVIAWGIFLIACKDAMDAGYVEPDVPKEPTTYEEIHWARVADQDKAAEDGDEAEMAYYDDEDW